MKRSSVMLLAFVFGVFLAGCSSNKFSGKRYSHVPRITVEENNVEVQPVQTTVSNQTLLVAKNQPVQMQKVNAVLHNNDDKKPTLYEKVYQSQIIQKTVPRDLLVNPEKLRLKPSQTKDARIAGWVLGGLGLLLSVGAGLMAIGIVLGNPMVYFIVGIIMATVGLVLSGISRIFGSKALGSMGIAIGSIAVFVLLIFFILVLVGVL